jgi:competence protein ComEA
LPLDPDPPSGTLLNINTATAPELELLPGIGPALAQSIVAYREAHGLFGALEDLLDVPGIGPAKLEQIRSLITVE